MREEEKGREMRNEEEMKGNIYMESFLYSFPAIHLSPTNLCSLFDVSGSNA